MVSRADTQDDAASALRALETDLEHLDAMAVAMAHEISKEQAAAVDRKLKLCNNSDATANSGGDKQARKEKKV